MLEVQVSQKVQPLLTVNSGSVCPTEFGNLHAGTSSGTGKGDGDGDGKGL